MKPTSLILRGTNNQKNLQAGFKIMLVGLSQVVFRSILRMAAPVLKAVFFNYKLWKQLCIFYKWNITFIVDEVYF